MPNKPIDNSQIYNLVNQARLEGKSDLKDLADKLESYVNSSNARLSSLETSEAVSKTKIGLLVAGISLACSFIMSVLIGRIR